jgi:hypothetical protein
MSVEGFGWKSLLVTDAPATCRLQHALLTSYDQPDARFLVEHFLPLLLGLDRDSGSEGIERQYFFGELTRRLEALHGQLVVVSPNRTTRGSGGLFARSRLAARARRFNTPSCGCFIGRLRTKIRSTSNS